MEEQLEHTLLAEQETQLETLQVMQVLFNNEKVGEQVPQTSLDVHD